jgi:hypothetical protein
MASGNETMGNGKWLLACPVPVDGATQGLGSVERAVLRQKYLQKRSWNLLLSTGGVAPISPRATDQLRDQRGHRRRYWPPFTPWVH